MAQLNKIAISGKGGVGKTTLSALLAHLYAEQGRNVIAIDADPAGGLAQAMGFPPIWLPMSRRWPIWRI
jgi:CO dehydrogenase maturation factor